MFTVYLRQFTTRLSGVFQDYMKKNTQLKQASHMFTIKLSTVLRVVHSYSLTLSELPFTMAVSFRMRGFSSEK